MVCCSEKIIYNQMKQFFSRVKTVNKILFACLILMGGLVAFSFYKQKADIVTISHNHPDHFYLKNIEGEANNGYFS